MKTEVITKKEIIIALLVSSIMLIYGIAQLHKVVSTSDYTATIETVSNIREICDLYQDYYEEAVTASYTDVSGKTQTIDVLIDKCFQEQLPKPGEKISILVSESGKVIEDKGYRQIGIFFLGLGIMGLVIVIIPPFFNCINRKFSRNGENEECEGIVLIILGLLFSSIGRNNLDVVIKEICELFSICLILCAVTLIVCSLTGKNHSK